MRGGALCNFQNFCGEWINFQKFACDGAQTALFRKKPKFFKALCQILPKFKFEKAINYKSVFKIQIFRPLWEKI